MGGSSVWRKREAPIGAGSAARAFPFRRARQQPRGRDTEGRAKSAIMRNAGRGHPSSPTYKLLKS